MPVRLRQWLAARWLPAVLAGVVAILSFPAYLADYQVDDWVHQARLRGDPILPNHVHPILELFTFMDGSPEFHEYAVSAGSVPWYTPPDMVANFLRPVSAATHWLDDAVARGVPLVAHVHSVLWYVLVVVLAVGLFRSVYRGTEAAGVVAGLAAVVFAIDDAHGLPVAWIANRNGIITCAFGLGILFLHRRAVLRGAWPIAAIVLLPVGLLAGEATLGVGGYLLAHALFLEEEPLRRRLVRLVPYAVVVVGWRAVYSHLGYGAAGSGLYVDPAREPVQFILSVVGRLPLLLADQWFSVPSLPVNFFAPGLRAGTTVVVTAALVGVGWLLWRRLHASATARFWAVGMLLAAVPVCATFPANRLLWFVGLGGAGILAEFVHGAWTADTRVPRWTARALVGVHVALAPVGFVANAASMEWMAQKAFEVCERVVPNDPSVESKTVIFVNSNDLCAGQARLIRAVHGGHVWGSTVMLAGAATPVEVEGLDVYSVIVRPHGGYHRDAPDQLFRAGSDPLPVGAQVRLERATVTIIEHNEAGYASAAVFRFDVPLTDPRHIWRSYENFEVVEFVPPRPGERKALRAAVQLD